MFSRGRPHTSTTCGRPCEIQVLGINKRTYVDSGGRTAFGELTRFSAISLDNDQTAPSVTKKYILEIIIFAK